MKKYKITSIPIKKEGGPKVKQRRGVRKNPDGSVSTHLMRAEYIPERGWVAFPSLFQDSKPYADDQQNWVDMSEEEDWMKIYEEAERRGEVYEFGEDKEAALAFGEGSWKDEAIQYIDNKYKTGGVIKLPKASMGRILKNTYKINPFALKTLPANKANLVSAHWRKGYPKVTKKLSVEEIQDLQQPTRAFQFGRLIPGKNYPMGPATESEIQKLFEKIGGKGPQRPYIGDMKFFTNKPVKDSFWRSKILPEEAASFTLDDMKDPMHYLDYSLFSNRRMPINSRIYGGYDRSRINKAFLYPFITSLTGVSTVMGAKILGEQTLEDPVKNAVNRKLNYPFFRTNRSLDPTISYRDTTINLNNNNLTFGQVNDKPKGRVLLGGDFIDAEENTVRTANQWLKSKGDTYGDEDLRVDDVKNYYGIEGGKFKVGKATDFKPKTKIVPNRYDKGQYVDNAFIEETPSYNKLSLRDKNGNPIYHNSIAGGKIIFYSKETGESIFMSHDSDKKAVNTINNFIKNNKRVVPIIIDNGRFRDYMVNEDGITGKNYDNYYSNDFQRGKNAGYNIIIKKDGGELPKAMIGGISKYNPEMLINKFFRNIKGIQRGVGELSGSSPKRSFSEIFPITQSQKIASDNVQREALYKGDDFIKKWTYGKPPLISEYKKPYTIKPGIQKKIQTIFESQLPVTNNQPLLFGNNNNFPIHSGYTKPRTYTHDALTWNRENPFNIQGSPLLIGSEIFNSKTAQDYLRLHKNLTSGNVDYVRDNYDTMGGVNLNTGPSVTIKDMGAYRLPLQYIEEIGGHEGAHTMQKLGYIHNVPEYPYFPNSHIIDYTSNPIGNRQVLREWPSMIQKYNPNIRDKYGKLQGYYVADPNTPLGSRFKKAMVEDKYWYSSPMELHADLMVSRMNAFKNLKKDPKYKGKTDDEIITIMQRDDDEMLKFIYETPSTYGRSLSKFFKPETPLKERLDLIKILPALTLPFAFGNNDDKKKKLQDGGELPKASIGRQVVKLGKKGSDIYNRIATGNTILPYAWKSPLGSETLHHTELSRKIGEGNIFKTFDEISQSPSTAFQRALIADYMQDSRPFTGTDTKATIGDGTVKWMDPDPAAPWKSQNVFDPDRKKKLLEIIGDKQREISFPKGTVLSRVVDPRKKELFNIDKNIIRIGDRPSSFTAGPATNIIGGGVGLDRLVLTDRGLKGSENKFLKNMYETLGPLEVQATKDYLNPIHNQGLKNYNYKVDSLNASMKGSLRKEREVIGAGFDLKRIGKVKNDRGGFDHIVRVVPEGYTSPNYEELLKNPYLHAGVGIGTGTILLGSDTKDDKKQTGGVIKIKRTKLNKFKH